MKLATLHHGGADRAAVVREHRAYLLPAGITMRDLIEAGLPAATELAATALAHGPGVELASADVRSPLRPNTLRDYVTFAEHVEGVRKSVSQATGVPDAWYDGPHFYFTNPHTVSGPDTIITPPATDELDFELEVAAVISGGGSNLTTTEAAATIFGYTILNDWSARDLQRREMQIGLGPAKGKDFTNTLGPVLVTADEFVDRHDADGFLDVACTATINGEVVGTDVTANMGWTFASMIAFAARDSVVAAGDVFGSGTTGNGGCLAEWWGRRGEQSPPPLQRGDVVELTVEGIGTLRNTVGVPADPPPILPAARRGDPAHRRHAHRPADPVALP